MCIWWLQRAKKEEWNRFHSSRFHRIDNRFYANIWTTILPIELNGYIITISKLINIQQIFSPVAAAHFNVLEIELGDSMAVSFSRSISILFVWLLKVLLLHFEFDSIFVGHKLTVKWFSTFLSRTKITRPRAVIGITNSCKFYGFEIGQRREREWNQFGY